MTPPPVKSARLSRRLGSADGGPATGGGVPPPGRRGGVLTSSPNAFVYLLQSASSGRHYVGATTTLQRRLEQHNWGAVPATRRDRPWRLIGHEAFSTVREARRREFTLKHNPNMYFLFKKRLLNHAWETRKFSGQVVG